jgi:hypothetical protein
LHHKDMGSAAGHEQLFRFRHAVARIGEADWFGWWESNALTDAGHYAIPRLFRRTPALSAAHIAFVAARSRQDAAVPREPLVHLFNFGELAEGAFERWLITRKAEGWIPEQLPASPSDHLRGSVTESLAAFGIESVQRPMGRSISDHFHGVRSSPTTAACASLQSSLPRTPRPLRVA